MNRACTSRVQNATRADGADGDTGESAKLLAKLQGAHKAIAGAQRKGKADILLDALSCMEDWQDAACNAKGEKRKGEMTRQTMWKEVIVPRVKVLDGAAGMEGDVSQTTGDICGALDEAREAVKRGSWSEA